MRLLTLGLLATTIAATPLMGTLARADDMHVTVPEGWRSQHNGNSVVLTPADLPEGKYFTLTILPETPLGSNSLEGWFESAMKNDASKVGTMVKTNAITPAGNGSILTSVRTFRDTAGAIKLVAYMGFRKSSGQVEMARIVSTPTAYIYRSYLKPAMTTVLTMAKGGTTTSSSNEVASNKRSSGGSSQMSYSEKAAMLRAQYTTKPGQGLKASEMAGIFSEQRSEMGVGGYMYIAYDPVIALKDGTYYDDFDVPPSEFNAAASKRLKPKDWTKWRRVGKQYQTYDAKRARWDNVNWIGPYSPAPVGQTLTGTYSSLTGGGNVAFGGGTMIAVSHEFTFFPNGTFKGGGSVSASSNEPLSDTSVVAGSTNHTDGTYKIDSYGITFRYKDGRIDRRTFLFMDEDKKDAIYLNGTPYLKDKH